MSCACRGMFHTCVPLRDAICICIGAHDPKNNNCIDGNLRFHRRMDRFESGRTPRSDGMGFFLHSKR